MDVPQLKDLSATCQCLSIYVKDTKFLYNIRSNVYTKFLHYIFFATFATFFFLLLITDDTGMQDLLIWLGLHILVP